MDKLHGKKQSSESKIKTVQKIRGGGPFNLETNLQQYHNFIEREFKNNENKNYIGIKKSIIAEINEWLKNDNNNYERNNLFYIYEKENNEIISIGVFGDEVSYNDKNYLYISLLLSKKKRNLGGTYAIYHILSYLSENKYAGICLYSTIGAFVFYDNLGFVKTTNKNYDLRILDKTSENISRLGAKLPKPITTDFYSTYPI
jgi:hypothetical protein